MRRAAVWVRDHGRDVAAAVALGAVAVGCWWAWPPLGLIVPGGLVLTALAYSHLRGG